MNLNSLVGVVLKSELSNRASSSLWCEELLTLFGASESLAVAPYWITWTLLLREEFECFKEDFECLEPGDDMIT